MDGVNSRLYNPAPIFPFKLGLSLLSSSFWTNRQLLKHIFRLSVRKPEIANKPLQMKKHGSLTRVHVQSTIEFMSRLL